MDKSQRGEAIEKLVSGYMNDLHWLLEKHYEVGKELGLQDATIGMTLAVFMRMHCETLEQGFLHVTGQNEEAVQAVDQMRRVAADFGKSHVEHVFNELHNEAHN